MSDPQLHIDVLRETFNIHRLPADADIPNTVLEQGFYALVRTADELSIVCAAQLCVESSETAADWRGLRVRGPLDLALTGILAHLSRILAEAGVTIFAVSTFDTDYVLVPAAELASAIEALQTNGVAVTTL
jgi:hypothetical protein